MCLYLSKYVLKSNMLYNSYIFIFLFLPITLFVFHLLSKLGYYKLTVGWLVAASLLFYGWWNPIYIALLIGSAIFNYTIGYLLLTRSHKIFLYLGIIGNLITLGYFKYANFFVDNINFFFNNNIILEQIILPLGISFFTFQQITFLVDTHLGKTKEFNFVQYFLFVTFFPQLISGPIVHHKRMMPQFTKKSLGILKLDNLAIGFTTFIIGLFKKVFLADNIAVFSTPAFEAASYGFDLTFFESWGAALAYTFQLYFDFSGYSDMALGLGLMFGIALPFNFLSPFKSKNISEFWRCWHISLSTLIRDYLYYPVSLFLTRYAITNKFGHISMFILSILVPTIFAFFWMGLWHGAGWHFVLFGLVHGVYLVIYNIWTKLISIIPEDKRIKKNNFTDLTSQLITFLAVIFSFVIFRADNIIIAKDIIYSMLGFNGIEFVDMFRIGMFAAEPKIGILWILISVFIVNFLPNTKEFILGKSKTFIKQGDIFLRKDSKIIWKPSFFWSIIFIVMLTLSLVSLSNTSEFLYFQF